ncbi:hypothetical protein T4C_11221 [Trichinella pseudospiralis]|uniref:Uncharacterized protein n=1 Tax=Trichinella pseudospiralis TaxID=6337 RepID=A0A0V1J7W3_TRIPS|nr:hypothetical protein T4C_11221 [Trichinella pseudospiralis]
MNGICSILKNVILSNVGLYSERCAANEQWRFQCDDGRRILLKTALNTKIEDESQRLKDDATVERKRYSGTIVI